MQGVIDPTDLELVRSHLAGLEGSELVERLIALATRDEGLELALVTEARAAAGSFELAELKKQLTAQLRVSSHYLHWRAVREYAGRIDGVLDVLEALLEGGHGAEVVLLAEHVMKRLDTALGRIDDSGGYTQEPVERLNEIHHAACVAARPDPRKLAVRMLELALKSDWEWFLDAPTRYADVLGDEGLAAYRRRLEPEWEKLPPLPPEPSRFHGFHEHGRFRVTHLREQLARAGGSIDELIAVLAHDRSSSYQFVRIAGELERAGREREALTWLERGVAAFPPAGDSRLRERLVAAYLRDGQPDDAVALVEKAFADEPTADTYAELRSLVDVEAWPFRRGEALETLRLARPPGLYSTRDHAVRAQLAEGDLAGAWGDARAGGCTRQVLLRLADASRDHDPDAAVRVYLDGATRELEHSDVAFYARAVDLLGRARETLAAVGRADELSDEIDRIREEHRRRPRLMAMLDEAGFGERDGRAS